jgi:queuine tRNA-ribosyltransferase
LFEFRIEKFCPATRARAGKVITPHGAVPTPAFAPVGSQGTVKTLTPDELRELGTHILLSNAYHLMLRPGVEVIRKMGGLHRFMGWDSPIITDSGGYQVFSLARLRKVSDEGALFRSHIDGSEHFLSPEKAVSVQEALGADIAMALDEPPAYGMGRERVEEATRRTHLWAGMCLAARREAALFGIVQGGTFPDLRRESALALASLDFSGYAIGGLSLGEPKEITWAMLDICTESLPQNRPRYLMGMGSPEDLVEGVGRGVDLFDSALPTRVARNGGLYISTGRVAIEKAEFREREGPLEDGCPCYTCRHFSAAYLHHLFRAQELLALRLATLHNLSFFMRLMADMRRAILEERFPLFRQEFLARYHPTPEEARLAQKQRWLRERL